MNVVLGVGGGVAAYKAAELSRLLQERAYAVQVVMTDAAQQFVQPLTFASLTGRKVITGLFTGDVLSSAIEHIQLAKDNQALIIASGQGYLFNTSTNAFTGPLGGGFPANSINIGSVCSMRLTPLAICCA